VVTLTAYNGRTWDGLYMILNSGSGQNYDGDTHCAFSACRCVVVVVVVCDLALSSHVWLPLKMFKSKKTYKSKKPR
jgi:hypothetical protein